MKLKFLATTMATLLSTFIPNTVHAPMVYRTPRELGINIVCAQKSEFGDAEKKSIDKLAEHGYTSLSLNPCYFQKTPKSSVIDTTTKFDYTHMIDLIRYAHSKHQTIMMKHLINPLDNTSREHIDPQDTAHWMSDYRTILDTLTKISIAEKVEYMTVGCELTNILKKYPDSLSQMIKDIKLMGYKGKIGYAANFVSEKDTVQLHILNTMPIDFIGIDFYVNMNRKPKDDPVQRPYSVLKKISEISKKPIVITEVGYRSVDGADKWPMFDYWRKGKKNNAIQAASFKNFLEAAHRSSEIEGVYIWINDGTYTKDILDSTSVYKTGYNIFFKPAEDVIRKYNMSKTVIAQGNASK